MAETVQVDGMPEVPRGECPVCHYRQLPVENGLLARHADPNPFRRATCRGSGQPPAKVAGDE